MFNLYNKQYKLLRPIEGYEACLWTERYDEHGDFVMKSSLKSNKPTDFPDGYFIGIKDSPELMRIDSSEKVYTPEEGRYLEVKARAMTSLLTQRTVWNQTDLDSTLTAAVQKLMNENILSGSGDFRKIDNLSWGAASPAIPSVYVVEAQFQGEYLYTAIKDLCAEYDIGFRITQTSRGVFVFRLYAGVDRSFDQDVRRRVIFSPEFDNLDKVNYLRSKRNYANVVRVAGEGEGKDKKYRTVTRGSTTPTGINRYEHYTTANRRSSNGGEIPAAKYNAYLDRIGRSYLKQNGLELAIDGEVDAATAAEYGKTYFLGDKVHISDGEDINTTARVVEFIRSVDASGGQTSYPSLRIHE